jgi:hypothetical protein
MRFMANDRDDSITPSAGIGKQPWETPRVTSAVVKDTAETYGGNNDIVPHKPS